MVDFMASVSSDTLCAITPIDPAHILYAEWIITASHRSDIKSEHFNSFIILSVYVGTNNSP